MKRKKSAQSLFGLKGFSKYGLETENGTLVYFNVQPTNISVLSKESIEIKIRNMMLLLCLVPDIEIVCTDSCECFDGNKAYMKKRHDSEYSEPIKKLLKQDMEHLDDIQLEMSAARQFMFCLRLKKSDDIQYINRVTKVISEHGFDVKRMSKREIKKMLAIYFGVSVSGDEMPDIEGEEYLEAADA